MNHFLIIDVASAPIAGAEAFLSDEPIAAPSTYKDPVKIEAYITEKRAERLEKAGLDLDLACLTGVGLMAEDDDAPSIVTVRDEAAEATVLDLLAKRIGDRPTPMLVTFNGHRFDLPLLMRRAAYLRVPFPALNLDRFRSPHVDLFARLTLNGQVTAHTLGFYARRLGWTDLVKPLSGADESRVPVTGRWDELAASLRHDVIGARRLAEWMGVMEPIARPAEAVV